MPGLVTSPRRKIATIRKQSPSDTVGFSTDAEALTKAQLKPLHQSQHLKADNVALG